MPVGIARICNAAMRAKARLISGDQCETLH